MSKLLVVDLGSTLFKFTIFDRNGQLCGCYRIAPPVVHPQPGYLELPADAFSTVIATGMSRVLEEAGGCGDDIEAVTFATQTNSFLLLDADNCPVTPIILWPDSRAIDMEDDIWGQCDHPEFTETTGIPAISYQFMVAKLAWLSRQQPAVWSRAKKLCLLSDYFTLLLTEVHVTEAGVAGLTGLVDIRTCRWWKPMPDSFGITAMVRPRIARTGTDLGPIPKAAAERFALPATCRFIVGCLDQYAGAIGVGAVEHEMVAETTGTVLATVMCTSRLSPVVTPGVFQGPSYDDNHYWAMAFGDVSANYLQWYRDQLPDRPNFEQLTELAGSIPPGADGLSLCPSAGTRSLTTVFPSQRPSHTRGHYVRSIMEGVAKALADQVELLSDGPQGLRPKEVRSAGGGARSPIWLQIKADALGIPVTATECPEPTSLGAAILAEASLRGTSVEHVAQQWVRLESTYRPARPTQTI